MALSNWDTLSVDLNGQSTEGSFTSAGGVTVAFRKNWLYIHDPKAWTEGGSFVESIVAQIDEGVLVYKDVSIKAIRGPQQGIYVVATSGQFYDNSMIGMIGCGVYGFGNEEQDGVGEDGYPPFVGVRPESLKFLQDWISRKVYQTQEEAEAHIHESWNSIHTKCGSDASPELLKDEKECEQRFRDSLPGQIEYCMAQTVFDEKIAQVDLSKALRYNQGDAYIAEHFGGDPSSVATEPGGAKETLLTGIVKNMDIKPENNYDGVG